jgi:hypothetical protein
MVLVGGLLGTSALVRTFASRDRAAEQHRFDGAVQRATEQLGRQLDRYSTELGSVRGL